MQLFKHITYNLRNKKFVFNVSFVVYIFELCLFTLMGYILLAKCDEWSLFLLSRGLEKLAMANWNLFFSILFFVVMIFFIKEKISIAEILLLRNVRWSKKDVYGLFSLRIYPFVLVFSSLVLINIFSIDFLWIQLLILIVPVCFSYCISIISIKTKFALYDNKKSGRIRDNILSVKYRGRKAAFFYKSFLGSNNIILLLVEVIILVAVAIFLAKLEANEIFATALIVLVCAGVCLDSIYNNIEDITFFRNTSIDRKTLVNLLCFSSQVVFLFGEALFFISKILFHGVQAINGVNMAVVIIYGLLFFYCAAVFIAAIYPREKYTIKSLFTTYTFLSLIPLIIQIGVIVLFLGKVRRNKIFMIEER